TGVQTCALPISRRQRRPRRALTLGVGGDHRRAPTAGIGGAVPRAARQRERAATAAPACRDRGRHRQGPPLLQRRGARSQHPLPVVPHRAGRAAAGLPSQRLLLGRRRRARARTGITAMKRLLIVTLLLLSGRTTLPAQDTGWVIDSFHVDYVINRDRTIDVTEWIVVDFGGLIKHGIYREINTRYKLIASEDRSIPAGSETVDLKLQGVADNLQRELASDPTRSRARLRIRIGDPDITVSGRQTYVIRYRLQRGLGFFENHDEF